MTGTAITATLATLPLALRELARPQAWSASTQPVVTVDVAAVQLNIYPWIHGTSRLRKDGLRRTNSNRQFQSYGKLTNRRTDDKIRVVLVWQSRVAPGWRKGPPHDKTDWSLDKWSRSGQGMLQGMLHGWLRQTENWPPSLAHSGLIRLKTVTLCGELAFQ